MKEPIEISKLGVNWELHLARVDDPVFAACSLFGDASWSGNSPTLVNVSTKWT
jgi:hypothetical protein